MANEVREAENKPALRVAHQVHIGGEAVMGGRTNIRTPSISSFKDWILASSSLLASLSCRDHSALALSSKSPIVRLL